MLFILRMNSSLFMESPTRVFVCAWMPWMLAKCVGVCHARFWRRPFCEEVTLFITAGFQLLCVSNTQSRCRPYSFIYRPAARWVCRSQPVGLKEHMFVMYCVWNGIVKATFRVLLQKKKPDSCFVCALLIAEDLSLIVGFVCYIFVHICLKKRNVYICYIPYIFWSFCQRLLMSLCKYQWATFLFTCCSIC